MRPLAALVSRLLHTVTERAGLSRFLNRQAAHVEETTEDQIGSWADEEGVPGALGLDQRYLLEHRAGLLPLGTAEVEDTAREQHRHRQERQGSHRVSSLSCASDGGAPAPRRPAARTAGLREPRGYQGTARAGLPSDRAIRPVLRWGPLAKNREFTGPPRWHDARINSGPRRTDDGTRELDRVRCGLRCPALARDRGTPAPGRPEPQGGRGPGACAPRPQGRAGPRPHRPLLARSRAPLALPGGPL